MLRALSRSNCGSQAIVSRSGITLNASLTGYEQRHAALTTSANEGLHAFDTLDVVFNVGDLTSG